jgi:hypothetical protein
MRLLRNYCKRQAVSQPNRLHLSTANSSQNVAKGRVGQRIDRHLVNKPCGVYANQMPRLLPGYKSACIVLMAGAAHFCPKCAGPNTRPMDLSRVADLNFSRCVDCGHIWTSPKGTPDLEATITVPASGQKPDPTSD